MRGLKYIKALYLSFGSKKFYYEVYREWKGFGVGFLLFVLVLVNIPLSWCTFNEIYGMINTFLPGFLSGMPEIVIKDGEMIYPITGVYEFKSPETGHSFLMINPNEEWALERGIYSDIIFGKRGIKIMGAKGEVRKSISYKVRDKEVVLNAEEVTRYLSKYRYLAWLVLFWNQLWKQGLFFIESGLVLVFFAYFLSRFLNIKINFKSLFRLSYICLTPLVLIKILCLLFHIHLFSSLLWVLTAGSLLMLWVLLTVKEGIEKDKWKVTKDNQLNKKY